MSPTSGFRLHRGKPTHGHIVMLLCNTADQDDTRLVCVDDSEFGVCARVHVRAVWCEGGVGREGSMYTIHLCDSVVS